MIGLLLKKWLLSNFARLLGWGAIASSVVAVLLGARQGGRKAERMNQLKETLKVKDAQLRAQLEAPRSRADLLKWLHKGKL